jgi:hypothetical protein
MSRLVLEYSGRLTADRYSFLEQLGLIPSALVDGDLSGSNVPAWFSKWHESRSRLTHIANLELWDDLMFQIGLSTYVLVDGLDELEATADNPYEAFDYIRPLLTNMQLIDGIPHLRVKFFLPASVQPVVMANSGLVRLDRIPVIETIAWSVDRLSNILQNRIESARSDHRAVAAGFGGLCVPGSEIEKDLLEACRGNPRYLMNLCAVTVEEHLRVEQPDVDDPYLLRRVDFQKALEKLEIRTRRLIHISDFPEEDYSYIQKVIREGESETIEFKQRAVISPEELKGDPKVENIRDRINLTELSLVKAIAGMMNTNGGVLLIGVEDDGTIFGIEKDMQAIKNRKDPDGFNQRLSRFVEVYLGLVNIRFLKTRFVQMGSHMVCMVKIEKAYWPVYLKNKFEKKDENGKPVEQTEFYIRGPAVTRKLSEDETKKYITAHWSRG